jgi:hypothetical protein
LSSAGTSTSTPTSSVGVSPHRDKNTSRTIAIVGGVLLLAVLGAIYVWYRRRQRRATGEESMVSPYPMSDTARPFAQLFGASARAGYFARTRKRGLGATGSPSGEEEPRPWGVKGGNTASPPVQTVRHEDSGLRLEEGSGGAPEIVELPPGYTPL